MDKKLVVFNTQKQTVAIVVPGAIGSFYARGLHRRRTYHRHQSPMKKHSTRLTEGMVDEICLWPVTGRRQADAVEWRDWRDDGDDVAPGVKMKAGCCR